MTDDLNILKFFMMSAMLTVNSWFLCRPGPRIKYP